MAEKKVLLDVDIKMTQAIKELGDLRMKMDELRHYRDKFPSLIDSDDFCLVEKDF